MMEIKERRRRWEDQQQVSEDLAVAVVAIERPVVLERRRWGTRRRSMCCSCRLLDSLWFECRMVGWAPAAM